MSTQYEHDVFISYVSKSHAAPWLTEYFRDTFTNYLRDLGLDLCEDPVFFDNESIKSGQSYPNRLRQALARSKCLIAIWSPLYFRSEWCRRECSVFLHREQQLGYRTDYNANGLILPIVINDGDCFPKHLEGISYLELHDYCYAGEGFGKTERFFKFQEIIKRWVNTDVYNALFHAPGECMEDWIKEEWQDNLNGKYDLDLAINFPQPNIG